MKKLIITSLFLSFLSNHIFAQILKDTIVDADGNIYHTIKIEDQLWMVENLRTTKYADGSEIPNIENSSEWSKAEDGAFCNYYNNEDNLVSYGRLYNWYVMNDKSGICPIGWHVPTNDEWKVLSKNIDSNIPAKETAGWWSYQFNGQDYLPKDYRDKNGIFLNENSLINTNYGGWWTSTDIDKKTAWKSYVGFSSYSMIINPGDKNAGFSILCLKNKEESRIMESLELQKGNYGNHTLKGKIIKIPFTDKGGRLHNDIYDLYFKTKDDQYFIRTLDSKLKHQDLLEFLNIEKTYKINIQFGLWDARDNEVQSRVGDYCEILEILD